MPKSTLVFNNGLAHMNRYNCAIVLAVLCSSFYCRFDAFVRGLYDVDVRLLRSCAIVVPHARHRRLLVGGTVTAAAVAFTVVVTIGVLNHVMLNISVKSILSYGFQRVHMLTYSIALFSCYVHGLYALRARMLMLMQAIDAVTTQRQAPTIARPWGADEIIELRAMFGQLNRMSTVLNACFAMPVMGYTGYAFICLLFHFFVVYKTVVSVVFGANWVMWLSGLWSALNVLPVLAVMWLGAEVERSGRELEVCICNAVNRVEAVAAGVEQRELVVELQWFARQCLHRVPVASCGLFRFDWTLLYSVGF